MIMPGVRLNYGGYLALVGGNLFEDPQNPAKNSVLEEIVKKTNARTIAVITAATTKPKKAGRLYTNLFNSIPSVEKVYVINIKNRYQANNVDYLKKEKYLEKISSADLIWGTGGDQKRQVNILKGTSLWEHIELCLQKKGVSYGGTSASATSASRIMLFNGDGEGHLKGTVGTKEGFGLLDGAIVDMHYWQRGRYNRLIQALAKYNNFDEKYSIKIGIGIDEDTGIIIDSSGKFKIVGNGAVQIIDSSKMCTNYHNVRDEEPYSVTGLMIASLTHGVKGDLNNRDNIFL